MSQRVFTTVLCICGILCNGAAPAFAAQLQINWENPSYRVHAGHFGHNSVWSRGGLGLWDEGALALDDEMKTLVQALKPGVLRFPGGSRAMKYRFYEAIGPHAERQPQCDTFTGQFDATGFGLDEFLTFAEQVGSQVTLVTPWTTGTPAEVAAMIAYVNGEPSSTQPIAQQPDRFGRLWGTVGDWAQKRVDGGRALPYNVRYLEIGNEPYLSLKAGPEESCGEARKFAPNEQMTPQGYKPTTSRIYAEEVSETARLVKAVDPSIKIGAAIFSDPMLPNVDLTALVSDVDKKLGTGEKWNPTLYALAGTSFDYAVLHPYRIVPFNRLTLADELASNIKDLRKLDPDKDIAVTEFGFFIGGNTLLNAIVSVDMIRVAVEHNLLMLLRHILIEDNETGLFANSAAIFSHTGKKSPSYFVIAELASHLKEHAFAVDGATSKVKALVSADDDKDEMTVVLIGRSAKAQGSTQVSLNLPGAHTYSGESVTFTGANLQVETDGLVRDIKPIADVSGLLTVELPSQSVMVVKLSLRR